MISAADIAGALRALGVARGDVLVVHSDLRRCLALEGRGREEKMATLLHGLREAIGPDGVLAVPTFTYSYCRGEDYDVATSPSTVGALGEHVRRLPGVRRTADPIFSTAIIGALPDRWEEALFSIRDTDSFGERSVFAWLEETRARLLFLGVGFEFCTFVYRAEQLEGVPYRYMKAFAGSVRDGARAARTTARYFVRDVEAGVENDFSRLERDLRERGLLAAGELKRGPGLLVTDTEAVLKAVREGLSTDPSYLLARPVTAASATGR